MTSIWAESLSRSLGQALDQLAASVRDCTDDQWATPMWQVPDPNPAREILDADGHPVTDTEQRRALVQRHATPWGMSWHALEVLDYDLNGEFTPWAPPPPFTGHPHWRDLTSLPEPWSRAEVLGYADHCREQVSIALSDITDEQASRPLPPTHRYRGQPHAWILNGLVVHTTEHASQIRQFITTAVIAPGA